MWAIYIYLDLLIHGNQYTSHALKISCVKNFDDDDWLQVEPRPVCIAASIVCNQLATAAQADSASRAARTDCVLGLSQLVVHTPQAIELMHHLSEVVSSLDVDVVKRDRGRFLPDRSQSRQVL